MREFIIFIREKGVIGLAIGIIMGGAVTRMVTSIVDNLINPLVGAITGAGGELSAMAYKVPFTDIVFRWGAVVSSLIDFLAVIAVVYFIFMKTPLASIDAKKDK